MTITTKVIETKLEDEVYIGEMEDSNDAAIEQLDAGTEVANGSYVVPRGVAVEELKNYSGHKDLKNKCPDNVRKLLEEKDLLSTYDKFVQSIVDTKTSRSTFLEKWNDEQFISVLDQFHDEFTAKGVKVALCKRKSVNGTYRWLEFIHVEELDGSYFPQYDVSNFSGQIIKTCYTKLKFPNGVAVEELKQWGGCDKLKENIPIHVEKMLVKHDLMKEYEQMVNHVVEAGVSSKMKMWNIDKLKALIRVYQPMFSAKGVDIFVSHKQEYIHDYGGHTEYFRWVEFVDREEQPSYHPQRDAESKKQNCAIM